MACNLRESSSAAVLKGLGEAAKGIFTCGGSLETPSSVQVTYLNTAGQWNGATFPGVTGGDFQQLLEASKVASFGIGSEKVTDKSYRDAYVLEPHQFLTSFQLCDTNILKEIQSLLVPDVLNVCAELYKINIYTAPSGCFKAHIDTPRGGKMFGSLVVCLPSQFSGGALVSRHNRQEIAYDWSSTCDDPLQKVQWAAFYSDVEHEITCVERGHRVTLTYNLYRSDGPLLQFSVTNSPLYRSLREALCHPHFLRSGGTLGFPCQHLYAFSKFEKSPESFSLYLKGSDRTLVLAAKSLSLAVWVKLFYNLKKLYWNVDEEVERGDDNRIMYISKEFEFNLGWVDEDLNYRISASENWDKYMNSSTKCGDHDKCNDVMWCQEPDWKMALKMHHHGNDPTEEHLYQAAAILVTVPQWSERN